MISAADALALETVRLTSAEEEAFRKIEASVDASIFKAFVGGPFSFRVPHDQASAKVVAAVKRAYESISGNGWCWRVHVSRFDENGGGHVLTFSPEVARSPIGGGAATGASVETDYRVGRSKKPRVALVADGRGWAFDRNARDLAAYLGEEFDFEHLYVDDWMSGERPDWRRYDVVYELYHRNPAMGVPADRRVSSLRSQWFRGEAPGELTDEDFALIHEFCAFHVTTRREYEVIRDKYARWAATHASEEICQVFYLTNPVEHRRFEQTPRRDRVVAEWNGSAGHLAAKGTFIKHFYDVVVPACERAGVPLVVAEASTKVGPRRRRTFEEMPAFYREANVALCASEVEGASNSVMEAMASGLAVVVTDVGNHREMWKSELEHFGDSGIVLVEVGEKYDSSEVVEKFTEVLRAFTPERAAVMGEINRAEIASRWSWDAWKDRYAEFLRSVL